MGRKCFSRLLSMLSGSILKAARWKGCFMSCLSVHNFQCATLIRSISNVCCWVRMIAICCRRGLSLSVVWWMRTGCCLPLPGSLWWVMTNWKMPGKRSGWLSRIICGDWCRMTVPCSTGFWMFITFISRRLLRRIMNCFVCLWIIFLLKPIRVCVALEVFVRQAMWYVIPRIWRISGKYDV